MAYVICKPCIDVKDTACIAVCPCDCIHPRPDEKGFAAADQLFIDPENCIHCNLCAEECPVRAIFPVEDVPEEWREFIEKNRQHFVVPP